MASQKIDVLPIAEILPKYPTIAWLIQKLKPWLLKKLLIVRPKKPGDAYTEQFSFPAAELVKNKAVLEGWIVIDLQANDASREKVTSAITEQKPSFVIQYDHGSTYVLWGQESNVLEPAIDLSNVSLISGRALSTVSCQTAAGLGPSAIAATARAYLGYDELHWVHLWHLAEFTEAANAANYALLEGKTFLEAYNIGYNKYTQKYNQLLPVNTVAASLMLHDRDHLTRLGDPSARAY